MNELLRKLLCTMSNIIFFNLPNVKNFQPYQHHHHHHYLHHHYRHHHYHYHNHQCLFWSWASLNLRSLSASSNKAATFDQSCKISRIYLCKNIGMVMIIWMLMIMMMGWIMVIMRRKIISQTFCPCGELSVSPATICFWLLLVKELV